MLILLPFLVFSGLSYEDRYSLVAPFVQTNISEFGNWTTRGSAVNLKKFFRLTSDIDSDYGALCQRVPTLFRDWSFEVEIYASNRNQHQINGGEGFWFFFTQEVCPDMPIQFTGISIWVNTTNTHENGMSPVFYACNQDKIIDFDQFKPMAYIKVRNTTEPVRLRITKKGNDIKLEQAQGLDDYQNVFQLTDKNIISHGYFTFAALTNEKFGFDNQDVYSIKTTALGPYDQKEFDYDISSKNRKIFFRK